jgi:hypothetical protein
MARATYVKHFPVGDATRWQIWANCSNKKSPALPANRFQDVRDDGGDAQGRRHRQSIDSGLARSRFGIVILSEAFFAKHWPQRELDGLAAREVDGVKVILPVWHNCLPRKNRVRAQPLRCALLSRVRGKDADLLNAQAALSEDGARAAREGSQAYLDGLRHTAERHAAVVDAYLALVSRPQDRQALLAQCAADPWRATLLRRSVEARTALKSLAEAMPQRNYGEAMARTAVEQRALDALDGQRPSAWKPLTRRQWADKQRAQRTRVASAQGAERSARSLTTGKAADALKAEARQLRAEIQRVERERLGTKPNAANLRAPSQQPAAAAVEREEHQSKTLSRRPKP